MAPQRPPDSFGNRKPLGSAQPWEPQPGEPQDHSAWEAERAAEREAMIRAHRRWETWQSIRRYLLVLLLTGLGSMIGSAITLFILLPYFD